MEIKPDLEATGFSCQNAFFFAKMSRIAYSTREEVRQLMQGDETKKGLGFDRFHWFEVKTENIKSWYTCNKHIVFLSVALNF